MRLWSLHPQYLDSKGLIALWRESLLAKKVLFGKTKGYKKHPQLERFKPNPYLIDSYLQEIWEESCRRGYCFDKTKIGKICKSGKIPVTKGQIDYEFEHLKKKLESRDPEKYNRISKISRIVPHPLFRIIKGPIEKWEKIIR